MVYSERITVTDRALAPVGSHAHVQSRVPVGSRCRQKDFYGAMSAPSAIQLKAL